MTSNLRIAVADDERDMLQYLETVLPRLGHQVVSASTNGQDLVEQCLQLRPDLVITDIKMPVLDGIQAAEAIYRELPVPVILLSAYYDQELIDRAEADHVLAYLIKPIKQVDLVPVIAIVMRRFQQFQAVRQEAADLRQALQDRKVIERAKGILMKRARLGEEEAFRRLQRLASDQGLKLAAAAQVLVTAEEAFEG